jgi:hypothetical protein
MLEDPIYRHRTQLREICELLWHPVGNAWLGDTDRIHCQSLYLQICKNSVYDAKFSPKQHISSPLHVYSLGIKNFPDLDKITVHEWRQRSVVTSRDEVEWPAASRLTQQWAYNESDTINIDLRYIKAVILWTAGECLATETPKDSCHSAVIPRKR